MPGEKSLIKNKQIVAELSGKLNKALAGVIVDYRGINVETDTKLRRELRENTVDYFVVKNTLLKLAAKENGLSGLDSVLEGTTAVALSNEDAVAPAKFLGKFAESQANYFNIKGGFVEGRVISAEEVMSLSKLPSKEILVAMALAGLNAPISGFVNVLNANIRGLAVALKAIAEQKGETPAGA
ncbi:MAG: 50S ribosomal protein L10 [Oscillospiraceae bacterium]|nr:50S ribosomal protein L10 [Oscillospiraceae bacterium]